MFNSIAAVVHAAGAPFNIEAIELPDLGPEEVLVRIVGVGICHTDISSRDGHLGAPFPSIFGHEGAGVVEAIQDQLTGRAIKAVLSIDLTTNKSSTIKNSEPCISIK
jgi:Zn-dependent alcohol dehydrogenase